MTPGPRTLWSAGGRFDVEALRAFAVISVICFHAGVSAIGGGFIGVDVFFVISGYLIIGLLYRGWQSTGRVDLVGFWARRARRLLPAASVVLAATALIAWPLSGRLTADAIRLDLLAAFGFSANLRFGLEASDYWAREYESPVLHFWSLGVEEQFYLLTPLAFVILAWLTKRFASRQLWLTLGAIAVITALSFLGSLTLAHVDAVWNYYSPFTRGWEFASGGVLAILPLDRPAKWLRISGRTFGWALLFLSSFTSTSSGGWPSLNTLLPVAATLLVLYAGIDSASCDEVVNRRSTAWLRPIAWLGGISYSAYLWHWPLLWAAANSTPAGLVSQVDWRLTLAAVAAAFWFASLTKYLIEDPIRFRPKLISSNLRSLSVSWIFAVAGASVVGLSLYLPNWNLREQPVTVETPALPTTWKDLNPDWMVPLISRYAPAIDRTLTPDTVYPGVATVADDDTQAQMDGCQLEFDDDFPPNDCIYGYSSTERSVVLFGDSHAGQFFTGLNLATEALGYRLIDRTRAGCPAARVTKYEARVDGAYVKCDEWRQRTISEIIELKPKLVIVSSYLTINNTMDPTTGERITDPVKAGEVWRAGLVSTLADFTRAGVPVLVVRDTPMWGIDVPDCLSTYGPEKCTPKLDGLLNQSALDLEIAQSMTMVRGIDLTLAICEPTECFPLRGDEIVMRDHSHISNEYSAALSTLWRAILVHELEVDPIQVLIAP